MVSLRVSFFVNMIVKAKQIADSAAVITPDSHSMADAVGIMTGAVEVDAA